MDIKDLPEKLVCACTTGEGEDQKADDSKHKASVDRNGELVIECEVCKQFLKFPKEVADKLELKETE